MDQELEYAQMLEVPVSTVSVVRKKPLFKKKAQKEDEDLKERVVESVNGRMGDFVGSEDISVPPKEKGTTALAQTLADKSGRILIIEVAAACLLAVGIFLTNVFMPGSAINTFIRSLSAQPVQETEYTDFQLFPVVSGLSDADDIISLYHHRTVDPFSIQISPVSGSFIFQVEFIPLVDDSTVQF